MFTTTKLPNGLTLLTAPQKQTKAVTVLVLLPVGSRYEDKNINGMSHFIEHMLFKGTEKRPTTLDISRALDSVGAEYNAFTSKDHTGYYVKASSEHLELAFDLLSDMLLHSKFDGKEMDKERGVIVEEINMYEDNPMMQVENLFEEIVFADHPLGWLISGPREVIKTVSRGDMIKYRDRFYSPSRMQVIVAGNFKSAEVNRLAKKYFEAKQKKLSPVAYSPTKTSQTAPRIKLQEKATEQVQLCLGFPAYSLEDPRIYPLHMLSIVLGGNMSSRLFVTVREKHGLAYFIRAEAGGYQDIGSFVVHAGLDKQRIDQAIKLILAELKKAAEQGITAKELKDAKEFLRGKFLLSLEDSEEVAGFYGRQAVLLKKILTPEQRLKKIMAVKLPDVAKAARDVINASRLNLAVIGPFKDEERFRKLLVM